MGSCESIYSKLDKFESLNNILYLKFCISRAEYKSNWQAIDSLRHLQCTNQIKTQIFNRKKTLGQRYQYYQILYERLKINNLA